MTTIAWNSLKCVNLPLLLGKNAFRNQEEAMENIMTLPNGKSYHDAIE